MDTEFYFEDSLHDYGDPYIEMNETISSMDEVPNETEGEKVSTLTDSVVNLLVIEHDFTTEDAEEVVNASVNDRPELWHDDASADDLAKFLASGDDDE